MKTDNKGIWIRCWDGFEMEYEHWTHKEIQKMIDKGRDNFCIFLLMQVVPDLDFIKYLDDLRGGNLG